MCVNISSCLKDLRKDIECKKPVPLAVPGVENREAAEREGGVSSYTLEPF